MPTIKKIDHVAIVVEDLDEALGFWRDKLGLPLNHVEEVRDQESIVAFLPLGESEVELVQPTSGENGVARYLTRRGPGMHHICFEVDDIEAYLRKLRLSDVRLINEEPVVGTGGKRIAFIHPESTHGVLVELYEITSEEPQIRIDRARELADRALASGQVMAAGVWGFLRGLRAQDDRLKKLIEPER